MSATSANQNESYCTFTLASDVTAGGLPSQEEISKDLENNDPKVKRHALKAAIMVMLGGETMPRILMQVIRFCINTDDKALKKLCMLYWEVVPKYQELTSDEIIRAASGAVPQRKLLPEMILVCNALRNDLIHPNEFVQGSMLRFLCKVKEEEIMSPLIPSVKACLDHKHPYVRKNAALTIFHAHKMFGENLIPDGPELVEAFLVKETDVAARRNAFLMLVNQNESLAMEFLGSHIEDVMKFGEGFAFLVLELTRKVCRRDPSQKSRFVRVLFLMLGSNSAAVSYETSWTLVSLSNAPSAVRAAASTYAGLLNSQNDNNVKMIVLERLEELKKKHCKILQEVLMDVLRALSSPNPDVCKKVLDITMDIITARNVSEVATSLKRELAKTKQDNDVDTKGIVYRTMLIKAIHSCALRFPDVADSTVPVLMDFLGLDGGLHVISFLRAIVDKYPELRPNILQRLINVLSEVSNTSILCGCLWIIGEYCLTPELQQDAFETITELLGEPPFLPHIKESEGKEAEAPKLVTKNVILSDGTYATQTSYSEPKSKPQEAMAHIRKLLVNGDVFLGIVLASCLTKLCLRASNDLPQSAKAMTVKTVLICCGIVRMAELSSSPQKSSASDCKDRISMFCRVLLQPDLSAKLKDNLLNQGRETFSSFLLTLEQQDQSLSATAESEEAALIAQPDDLIHFRQLNTAAVQAGDLDLDDGTDLTRAVGYNSAGSLLSSELSHVYQLSGFADPVYAEALVTVHDYDISLEILLINRTPNALSNLMVELSTMGDMKIVERPQSLNIGPLDQTTVRASIKVSSTETGHIFGTIVYDDTYTQSKVYINLNDIHMDIMDYIHPATCTDEVFRSMWAEFEWENKVAIATTIGDLRTFLDHIVKETNMKCLTKLEKEGQGNFLAANLYAKSVFGEDALVNVSVEKKEDNDGKLAGYIRIRSKTQGIALSLGDRITSVQRGVGME